MPVDPSLLDRDISLINERYGNDMIHTGAAELPIERIPLGPEYPGLNRILGGGVACGRVMRCYGDPSTGKTLLAWEVIRAAQNYRSERFPNGLGCCYWNVEAQFDKIFVKSRGVDTDKLMIMNHKIIEDIAATMEVLLSSVHLHVIDSASFASPLEEIAGKKDSKRPEYDVQVGAHARAWKRAINRIHNRMDKNDNIVFIIDHMSGPGVSGGARSPLSGRRIEFRSDCSMHLRRGAWLYYSKNDRLEVKDKVAEETGVNPEGQRPTDGIEVVAKIEKSRTCRPLQATTMRLDLNSMEFDYIFELINFGVYYDEEGNLAHRSKKAPIISKTGNGWYGVPGYEKKFNGMDALHTCVTADPMLQQTLRRAMIPK